MPPKLAVTSFVKKKCRDCSVYPTITILKAILRSTPVQKLLSSLVLSRVFQKKSGIERWKKFHGYLHQPLNLQNLDSRTLLDGVVKVLRETQNESYFTDNSNKYIIVPVFVEKIRKNSYGYEHAYFSLRFSLPQGIQPVSASDQEWYFESVNIEGYKKRKHIPHDLMNRHFQEKDGILTMGYPELIYTWYRKNYFKKI
ncbi:hypothetical protein FDP41_010259 [Naegleria fowleri]|uniref:Uncharacterized protein n=1 Tax=Naegleria fowleri TaxID=5763 RepID=A0A6A5C9I5_NAEFO|nr:uncharacterized protein FDP41_010259 [Naegleria fowleri]KAF0983194.1 hypothetical protein FDP41_010259 [Naegleria fowleri]